MDCLETDWDECKKCFEKNGSCGESEKFVSLSKCEENQTEQAKGSAEFTGYEPLIAKYKCMECEHKYTGKPGPTTCPECGHEYVKWLNYREMESKYFR